MCRAVYVARGTRGCEPASRVQRALLRPRTFPTVHEAVGQRSRITAPCSEGVQATGGRVPRLLHTRYAVAFRHRTRAALGAQPSAVLAFKGGPSSAFPHPPQPTRLHPYRSSTHLCPRTSFLMGEITFPTAGPKPSRPKMRDGKNAARAVRAPRLEADQPAYVVPPPLHLYSH